MYRLTAICWNPHSRHEKWGRYTFLGFDPKLEITCTERRDAGRIVSGSEPTIRPKYLRQILADYKSPRFDYLPSFTGGLVGYFSYDYLGYSEPAVETEARKIRKNFKDVDLMLFRQSHCV